MFHIFTRGTIATAIALLIPTLALAHTGAPGGAGFAGGFLHPLTGIDHLLAIVAVGVIAARRGGRDLWRLPLLFAGLLASGALAGPMVPIWPPLEIAVGVSAGALWLWALAFAKGPLPVTATVLAAFAVVHGIPHGWELSSGATDLAAVAGAFGASLALAVLAGVALSRLVLPRLAKPNA